MKQAFQIRMAGVPDLYAGVMAYRYTAVVSELHRCRDVRVRRGRRLAGAANRWRLSAVARHFSDCRRNTGH